MSLLVNIAGSRKKGSAISQTLASNVKNVQKVDLGAAIAAAGKDYTAFGQVINLDDTYAVHIFRAADGHLVGGQIWKQIYNKITGIWEDATFLYSTDRDIRDVYSHKMSNGEIIVFSATHYVLEGAGNFAFYLRLDSDLEIIEGPIPVSGDGTALDLPDNTGVFPFGPVVAYPTAGHYSQTFFLYGNGIINNQTIFLKTTDYWETWTTKTISSNAVGMSESFHVLLPGGDGQRMFAASRIDQGGSWFCYYSSDLGETWTARGNMNMGHYNVDVKVMHPWIYNGKMHIIFQDRDSGYISVSRNNDPDLFFDNVTNFQPVDLVHYNHHSSSNYNGLGYPSIIPITEDENPIYLYVFAKETQWVNGGAAGGKAEIWYGRENLITDPVAIAPDAPSLTNTYLAATGANVTIGDHYATPGYTLTEMDNIKYFLCDVALDAGFTNFATVKWMNTGPDATAVMQNKRLIGNLLYLRNLTASTTYYVRIKAVNNTETSDPSIISFTTLSS